jgi:NAD(P)-dependent dehydrogenase (short-subunit alcohol dehydrogenase family)
VTAVSADLESPEAVKRLVHAINETSSQVDVIYNNAAFFHPHSGSHYEIPASDFKTCFCINALAPILIANALIPDMLVRGFGRIINVSTALQHQPNLGAYAVSKAALDKFVYDLAPTLNGSGVAINLVDPGSLRTDMNPTGLYPADSALNGLLLAALYDRTNGCWLSAQDYSGLSIDEAHAEMFRRFDQIHLS